MKFTSKIALSAAAVLAVGFTPVAAKAETVLRYSNFLPAGYVVWKDVQKPWIDDIEKQTNGRVKIDVAPKVVGAVNGQYDVVVDGLVDISFVVPGYSPGRFRMVDGLEAPFLGGDPEKRCLADWNAWKKHYEPIGYMPEVKVLSVYCTSPGHFVGNRFLKTMDDFKNFKVRVGNAGMIAAMETLGALPVNKPASELYEMASGGIIDAAIFPLDTTLGFKLDEVWKYATLVPGGMSVTPVFVVINKGVWDKLPDEDKKVIEALSGEALAKRAGAALAKSTAEAEAKMKANGVSFFTMDDATVAQVREKFQPLLQAWIDDAKKEGMKDPEGMLAEMEAESK
ncbi:MAG: TRAP transporter substrate-binding protein [Rhodobiaceae bacterium]|nr:TRAP transporter substrate-binding protein [Rhodobiaceae bacterium]MCC0057422.1 TRAP transporter substrate-binding protein [Rhodobiaceae bacterium]